MNIFSDDDRGKRKTLAYLVQETHNGCNGNKIEAAQQMVKALESDGRFAKYDADRLVARIQECGGSGAQLDLEDPALMRGGQPRYLSDPRFR